MVGILKAVRFVAAAAVAVLAKGLAAQQVQVDWVGQVADLLGHPSEIILSLPRIRTGLLESTSWAAAAAVAVQAPLPMEFREITEVQVGFQAAAAVAVVQARAVVMVVVVVVARVVSFIYG